MKTSDITDEAFLDAVRVYNNGQHEPNDWDAGVHEPRWSYVWEIAAALNAPEKIIRSKARRLIDRGLMEGCPCGCRGDFRVYNTLYWPFADERHHAAAL